MGFDDGQIILDSENGAYYAGQTVYGRMVFTQGKVKTIHGIYVDIKGFCKVHWTTTRSRRHNNRTTHYTVHHDSHEEYFRRKHFVFGNESGFRDGGFCKIHWTTTRSIIVRRRYYTVHHDSHEEYFRRKHFIFGDESGENQLQMGQHEFRFECHIPAGCPSSYEGSYGHIRYRIKVVMVTSGMFTMNKDKWVPVKVSCTVGSEHAPRMQGKREPMDFEMSSSYCCWCMSAGTSEITVRMPVSGYCPGQVIPMEVSCQNDSNVEIDEIKFAIKKDVVFRAVSEPGTRTDHDTVAEIKKGPIPGRTTRNWTIEMEVPAMDLYNVLSCSYIDINYTFKVSTEVSGCHKNKEETRRIIFGTVPLVGFQDTVQNPLHDQLPQVQTVPDQSYTGGQVYPSNTPYSGLPSTPNTGGRTSPYPAGNQPYPNVTPYPNAPPYSTGPPYPTVTPLLGPFPPGGTSSLFAQNSPYGSKQNLSPPYPGPNPNLVRPYPGPGGASSPFAQNSPHGSNQNLGPRYPGPSPNPVPPYPGAKPDSAPPYPGARQSPLPYPGGSEKTPLKTGTIGFGVAEGDGTQIPLLPVGAGVPYPMSPSNPYAASAPEPSTPGSDEQKPPVEDSSDPPPYNPEYMKRPAGMDKKEDKKNEKDNE